MVSASSSFVSVGKPIITSVDGECRKLIEEAEAGLFAEPEDVEDLKEKILYLHVNPEKRKQMGINGRNYVQKYFDRTLLADNYFNIIESVIG